MAAAVHHDYVLHYYLGIYKCSYFTHSLSSSSCVQPIGLKTDPYNGMRGIPPGSSGWNRSSQLCVIYFWFDCSPFYYRVILIHNKHVEKPEGKCCTLGSWIVGGVSGNNCASAELYIRPVQQQYRNHLFSSVNRMAQRRIILVMRCMAYVRLW
jgi:hypothetical protein